MQQTLFSSIDTWYLFTPASSEVNINHVLDNQFGGSIAFTIFECCSFNQLIYNSYLSDGNIETISGLTQGQSYIMMVQVSGKKEAEFCVYEGNPCNLNFELTYLKDESCPGFWDDAFSGFVNSSTGSYTHDNL